MGIYRVQGFTLAPGASWYSWFHFKEVPWTNDDRTMFIVANTAPGRDVFIPELWCVKIQDQTNAAPPFNSFNVLAENRSKKTVGYDLVLTTFA